MKNKSLCCLQRMRLFCSILTIVLIFAGISRAGNQAPDTIKSPVTPEHAEKIIRQIPEVRQQAETIRAAGARPFTMMEASDEVPSPTGSISRYYTIYFGEDHDTHTVRHQTFLVDRSTGNVFVYAALTDTIISLHTWQTLQQPVITMERTMCYGKCPVYQLAIYQNGRVIYVGKEFVRIKGKQTGFIDKTRLTKLIRQFDKAHFFFIGG